MHSAASELASALRAAAQAVVQQPAHAMPAAALFACGDAAIADQLWPSPRLTMHEALLAPALEGVVTCVAACG